MKVTYNWLRDFIEIEISALELAEKLTMAGLEVTSLEEKDGDFVFEIEITSNRPDWLSVVGIAREVSAITGKKLKRATTPQICKSKVKTSDLRIDIEDKNDCPLYTAKVIRGVKLGPSPDWLKKRLELVGCRSVNNVVDITNYVLFETGEPLHAFDLDKMVGSQLEIKVRRAKNQEKMVTIDAIERTLTQDVLLIADARKPVAIAGVMGGKDTEVSYATKNILLEAAVFHPVVIRRARQKLGLQTDSSYRFERSVDALGVEGASWRAVQLIQQLAGGECVMARASGKAQKKNKVIQLNAANVCAVLGAKIPTLKIKSILLNLGFQLKQGGKSNLQVTVPSHRQDVNLEIDLIEEIARIFGFARIPVSLPRAKPQVSLNTSRDTICLIKNALIGLGLNEVVTYSLIDRDWLDDFNFSFAQPVEILNPLSKEQEILRPSVIPSLARCVAFNLHQKQSYVAIFEIAKNFFNAGKSAPGEELVLGIALCGEKTMLLEKGLVKEEIGLRHLKGVVMAVFEQLGIKDCGFKMGNTQRVSVETGNKNIGFMSQLLKSTLDRLDIKNREVVVAEINLEKVFPLVNLCKKFFPLPKFPGITRDISILIKVGVTLDELLLAISAQGKPWLSYENVGLKDNYVGKQIPAGHKAITISCLYRSDERTLTEDEINPKHLAIVEMLKLKFGAEIR